MHLLHILPRLPAPPNDGGAVYVYNMLRELRSLGHRLTIVSLISNKHDQNSEQTAELGELFAEEGNFKPYSLYSVIKSTLTRQPITIQHRMKTDIVGRLLSKVSDKPDVILLEGLHTAAFLDLARKRFPEVPIVLRQVNVEYLLLKRNGSLSKNLFKKWFYFDQAILMKRFELQKMRDADYVTSISENDIRKYRKDLPDVEYFLNTAGAYVKEDPESGRDPSIILAVSNWRWQPNLDGLDWFLNEIWPAIHNQHPKMHFHIAGEGLSESFKNRYVNNNIHFLGFVDDIDSLRNKASIFVAPLLSGSGMKLKVIEALAAGMPTVTTSFGAEGIEIEDKIHYLHADEAKQFEHAVISLIQSRNLRIKLSSAGKEQIKLKYTWKQKAQDLSSFLEKIKKIK
ncbi:MAG: glycosyltransferase family 4 protein [Balneolaceae bacterium]